MENIYCYNNDKFEKFIKEKLNSKEYELIKKYSVNDITSKTNDITKWLYKMFSENQLPKTDLKINNSWFYCEIFEVYNKFVKSKKIKHIRDYKKWDEQQVLQPFLYDLLTNDLSKKEQINVLIAVPLKSDSVL